MNYYQSLLVTMLCFKGFVLLVIFVAWLVPLANMRLRAYRQWLSVPKHLRSSSARRRFKRRLVAPMQRRRSILGRLRSTDWVKVRRVFAVGFLGCWLPCFNLLPRRVSSVLHVCCMCAAYVRAFACAYVYMCVDVGARAGVPRGVDGAVHRVPQCVHQAPSPVQLHQRRRGMVPPGRRPAGVLQQRMVRAHCMPYAILHCVWPVGIGGEGERGMTVVVGDKKDKVLGGDTDVLLGSVASKPRHTSPSFRTV